MKTADYCAAAKRALGITSDYELAKRLGVSKQRISSYVNGQRAFGPTMAVRIAEVLGVDWRRVLADAELERGSNDELWKRIRDAAAVTLLALGAALFGAAPQPAYAGFDISVTPRARLGAERPGDVRNMHCQIIRRWLRKLLKRLPGARP